MDPDARRLEGDDPDVADLLQPPRGKAELLAAIHADRQRFDAAVARVPRERLTERGVGGEWSVKDVLAHIAWSGREAARVLRTRALGRDPIWELSDDERNAIVFERERKRSLDDVLGEYRESWRELIAALEEVSEEELNDPSRFRDMVPGWRPWRIVYDPGHYGHHARDIERWLGG